MQAGAGAAPLLRNTTAARCDRISKRSIAMRVEGAVVHLPLRVTRLLCSQANNMQRKSESGDSCAPTGHEARHFDFRQIVENARTKTAREQHCSVRGRVDLRADLCGLINR